MAAAAAASATAAARAPAAPCINVPGHVPDAHLFPYLKGAVSRVVVVVVVGEGGREGMGQDSLAGWCWSFGRATRGLAAEPSYLILLRDHALVDLRFGEWGSRVNAARAQHSMVTVVTDVGGRRGRW